MAPKRQDTCKICGGERAPNTTSALCVEHYRAYMNEKTARYAASHAEQVVQAARLKNYLRHAASIGANEEEAWWLAMAAEAERAHSAPAGTKWLAPFLQRELTWLRTNAAVLERLDAAAYAPVLGEAVIVDEGWDEMEMAS